MTQPLRRYAGSTILVVDDDRSNLDLLLAILTRAGIVNVHTESDSRLVAARLVELDPDLLLLDLNMPHLDGRQVLGQVAEFAAGQALPVLLITGDTGIGEVAGAAAVLTKPYDLDELLDQVAALLAGSASS
ncbi:MAG: response regulator [Jatrophihabitantaceae bacterium]